MEEDIKKLDRIITRCKYCAFKECINCEISCTEAQAIENLLKRYKELEEENRIFALAGSNIALKHHIEDNYIPTSVIQNILDELDEKIPIAQGEELIIFEAKEDVLQEILEERNK